MHLFQYKVTLEEILRGKLYDVLKPDVKLNIKMLLFRINYIRHLYGHPFVVTSGLRNMEDQKRVNPKAMASNHLIGAAIDIADNDGELHYWCKSNEEVFVDAGIWMETRQGNWQHFQIYPPKSGKRWFDP